jgi:PAS domain-containing protein
VNPKVVEESNALHEKARLFDSSIIGTPQEAVEFITNILESSTEYSVIAKDLTGKIVLWNEGARRLYSYEPDEVVGKANSSILHTPQDVKAGIPEQSCMRHSTTVNGKELSSIGFQGDAQLAPTAA